MSLAPPSDTDQRINAVGLLCMLAGTAAVLAWKLDVAHAIPILMALAAGPILLLDLAVLRVHLRPATGLDWSLPRPRDPLRVATRWLGGVAALVPVLLIYALAPEYQGDFYDPWYAFLRWFAPLGAIVGTAYVIWIDALLVQPRDAYWQLGAALTRQTAPVWEDIGQVVRSWLVKGFFVPLMFVFAGRSLVELQAQWTSDGDPFLRAFETLWHLGFLIDVVFTTAGYLATFRVFDTHIRSAEPTLQGWVAALCCYPPFFGLLFAQYVMYESGYQWGVWLEPWPAAKVAWGVAILGLLGVFTASTVSFGCRFSNLTHRGVVTNGPYRWTRHPAYVSKCASYWLIFVPFVYRGSAYEVVRDCVWLAALCGIYVLRAKTEERHLSRDPAYVAYAQRMNDCSIFAPLGRWFPFLAYRAPA